MSAVFQDGWIPDMVQKNEAERAGRDSDYAALRRLAEVWTDDVAEVPPVLLWESMDQLIDGMPEVDSAWWTVENAAGLFTPSQEWRPNCAGFAMANAAQMRVLIQRKSQYSENRPEKFNPFPTWILSKNGSVWGGQTIAKIARYGNEVGNYLAEDVGDYDPSSVRLQTNGTSAENAAVHQIGVCYYEGNSAADDLIRALKKGFTAFVGQSVGVRDGVSKDENGVECAVIGGSWAHATAFGGWKNVNGTDYVFWVNSHGNIYKSGDGTPDFGCWMSRKTLERFLHSTFCDICFVTYAESRFDVSIPPTLNFEKEV